MSVGQKQLNLNKKYLKKKPFTKIVKRNGSIAPFEEEKITVAILKAGEATGEYGRKIAERLSAKVVEILQKQYDADNLPVVEKVQDTVEHVLMDSVFEETAKAYIVYRRQHEELRKIKLLDPAALMNDYLGEETWYVKENANMAYSLQGLRNHVAEKITERYWLEMLYPGEIREAHQNADLHIHDLGSLSSYCAGWDLKDLITRGFGGVTGKIQSHPAKHLKALFNQIVNFMYTITGEVAGAVAFSSFDVLVAPFVRYDKLTEKEVRQAMQEFVYGMNIPTRVGFQTPFTNITMDLTPSGELAKENVIIGGVPQKEKYADFQPEIDMINKAFAEVMLKGDASGRIFSFPIPTYNITKDFDWNNKTLDPVWEMTAKYGIPYFSNFINSDMSPDDARSMCPLAGTEKVLIKSSRGRGLEYGTIRNIYEGTSKKTDYEVYSNGQFVSGHFNRYKNQKMIKVLLDNGHEIKMTKEHLNYVLDDTKEKVLKGSKLVPGMYLPYSLKSFPGEGGDPELGFLVGAYAGDGSFDKDSCVVFSLENHFKKELITKLEDIALRHFGARTNVTESKKTKLVTLRIYSKALVGLCRDFVEGKEREKHYTAKLFNTSIKFREQVLAGHYATDGGNRHRIYTSSKKMVETLNMLAATLGTTTSIYTDNRDNRLGKEPNYAVLIYQLNREKYGNVWIKKNEKLWVRIKNITQIANSTAYCFEVSSGPPMFTVGTTGILTHNCRLRLDNRELRKRGGGLFGSNPLTGSIGVVTINLARLGYVAKNEKEYLAKLDHLMDLSKESLVIKRKVVERFMDQGLYPFAKYYLCDVKERFGSYWANHFSTIGLIGMNESIKNLLGEKEDITTKKGNAFAIRVMNHMREKIQGYQEETGDIYNLEATPGEGTSTRFAKRDKAQYPAIIVANEEAVKTLNASPYYTNSTALPVNYTKDIFEALDLQDNLQTLYTGGTVLHGFLGERIDDIETVKKLVRKIAENYHLPYFTLSPTFSICPKHGYLPGEHFFCPKCDEEIGYKEQLELIDTKKGGRNDNKRT